MQASQQKTLAPELDPVKAQRKIDAASKRGFELHVALIMNKDDVNQNTARFRAWAEGPKGLDKRLNPAVTS